MNNYKPLIAAGWIRATLYILSILSLLIALQFLSQPLQQWIKSLQIEVLNDFFSFVVVYVISAVVIFTVTYLFTTFIERRYLRHLGFDVKGYEHEAGIGFFVALFMLCSGSLLLIVTGHLTLLLSKLSFTAFLLQFVLMVVVAFTEELMFRGYILGNLMQSTSKWFALIITSLLFAAVHITNPNTGFLPVLNVFLAGLLLGLNYMYTKNLWFGIVLHFTWNFIQGAILGFDVSGYRLPAFFAQIIYGPVYITGGEFGFEGSIICSGLLIIACILLFIIFEKRYVSPSTASDAAI